MFTPLRLVTASAVALFGAVVTPHRVVSQPVQWVPTSDKHLEDAETKILECVKTPLKHMMVPIGGGSVIHTVVADAHDGQKKKPTLVLVHGFGGGVGLWANNFDALADHFVVYAIDVLGFGRSSRPPFTGTTAKEGRAFFVDSLESWRQAVGLDNFVLLGHSLGGLISAHYALEFPKVVEGLILAAPFGLSKSGIVPKTTQLPLRYRVLRYFAERTSPQALVRAAGPWGPGLVTRMRGRYDNVRYSYSDNRVSDYVYHLQAGRGSAEYAFMALQDGIGFAKEPYFDDMARLTMPVGFIYGSKDFITPSTAYAVRPTLQVPSEIYIIDGAHHHAYATHADEFSHAVLRCAQLSMAGAVAAAPVA